MKPPSQRIAMLVTDLDNTLWDWLTPWALSMNALVNALHTSSSVPKSQLLHEIRVAHRRFGTVEYSMLIRDLPSLAELVGADRVAEHFDEAVHEQNKTRKTATKLYPHVLSTLRLIRSAGVPVVAFSEGLEFS